MATGSNTSVRGRNASRKAAKKKKRNINLNIPIINKLVAKGGSTDFLLVLFTAALAIFGLIMIFSASYYYSISRYGTPYYYLIRHGIWLVGGVGAFCAGAVIDYRFYKKVAPWAAIGALVLLLLLFTPLGVTYNNATRWLGLGPITIMPGEITKMCAIMFTAWYLGEKPDRIDSLFRGVLPIVGIGLVYAGLIVKQPNLSTALTVVGIMGCMLIVAGLHKKYIVLAFGAAFAGVMALTTVLRHTYWYGRFASFLDPFADPLGDGYQVVQSLLALGSGGLFGKGLGESVMKNLYLPEPQNDFILAIIGEELGLVGIMGLMLLYSAFLWRGAHVAIHARDQFGVLLASGIVLMVAIQVILNVAVVTSSMPATGINLPFISYGGNAILLFMFGAGILVNISRSAKPSEPVEKERSEE